SARCRTGAAHTERHAMGGLLSRRQEAHRLSRRRVVRVGGRSRGARGLPRSPGAHASGFSRFRRAREARLRLQSVGDSSRRPIKLSAISYQEERNRIPPDLLCRGLKAESYFFFLFACFARAAAAARRRSLSFDAGVFATGFFSPSPPAASAKSPLTS